MSVAGECTNTWWRRACIEVDQMQSVYIRILCRLTAQVFLASASRQYYERGSELFKQSYMFVDRPATTKTLNSQPILVDNVHISSDLYEHGHVLRDVLGHSRLSVSTRVFNLHMNTVNSWPDPCQQRDHYAWTYSPALP